MVTVGTPMGTIQGQIQTTYTNVEYESFKGIPYAEPPIGTLRFAVRYLNCFFFYCLEIN